jgi:hypothetical protein
MTRSSSLLSRVIGFLLTLVVIGVLARIVWQLLAPLLPILAGVSAIPLIAAFVIRRNRTW